MTGSDLRRIQSDNATRDLDVSSENDEPSETKKSDDVPDGGSISRGAPSTLQVLLAVAGLVLVTVVAFVAVSVVGDLFVANRNTYWMIELIFALLCGGAGALVGGSAVVRSTLRIPGSPVHATLGGAIAMVIVGFALAYLGQPPEEAPMYAVEIHNVPDRQTIGNDEYRVFVGAVNSTLTFSRDPNNVSLRIPPRVDMHRLLVAIYRPVGKDLSRTFARCELSFEIIAGQRGGPTPMDLVSAGNNSQFHLYFSRQYINQVVTAALQRNELISDQSCVEGRVATKSNNTPLDGHFTLQANSVGSRAVSFARLSPLPRYSVLARDRSNLDPQDTLPDLPPHARPEPVGVKVPTSISPSESSGQSAPRTTQLSQTSGRRSNMATSSAEEPDDTSAPPSAPAVRPEPKPIAVANGGSLNDQVDAYVRGEDRDRTQLYQSWDKVADYVVQGLRNESAKGSAQVAPYLNLLSNALNVIDDGRFLSPSLRPSADPAVKSERLSKSREIPGFRSEDYRIVVDSLCSSDEDVRRAAQRLLKLYPSNHFYQILQALSKPPVLEGCRMGFIAETATYYFYNRIVEYDGSFPLDKGSRAWIGENYSDGIDWAKRGEAAQDGSPLFAAMLDYAHGLVLLDHGERKDALPFFNQMIDSIRTSGRVYPSNPQQIATALRLTQDPGHSAKALQAALPIAPPDRRSVAKTYLTSEGIVPLFAMPDTSAKPVGRMKSDAVAHAYLRLGNWELVEGGGQIGWARRAVTNAQR